MKKLKYFLLMAVPVVLLSCGQSNTQNRENRDDGGMGSRDRSYQQNDQDRTSNPGIQSDTSRYRSGSGSQGMGSGRDTSTVQGSSRSGSGSQGSSTQQGSSSRSGSQGSSTQQGSSTRSGSQNNTNRSTNQDNTQVNPR